MTSDSQLEVGRAQAIFSASGTRVLRYTVEMYHKGLNEHKVVSAPEIEMLQNKANLQAMKWDEKWNIVSMKRRNSAEKEANVEEAREQTESAQEELAEIENLLMHTLPIDDTVDWEMLKKRNAYPKRKPVKPEAPQHKKYPEGPYKAAAEFVPEIKFLDKVFSSRKDKKILECSERYAKAISDWEKEKASVDEANAKLDAEYQREVSLWEKAAAEWEKMKAEFLQGQEEYNARIDEMKKAYMCKNPDSIVEYCEMVLNNSTYPEAFPKTFELEYNPETGILIVEYSLPTLESLPTLKDVNYVASKGELKETHIPDSQRNKMFEDAIYKITIRTIHELFEADAANALASVSFNGWVESINKGTGKRENNCIISVQAKKAEFLEIDLKNIDPKTCVTKTLKGVAAPRMSALTPIPPIMQLSKTDKRFVESYSVVGGIDNATNLAAMDWEDFEHLIRELFEKEFMAGGGEVKITQASRDGGVDAIAFDPDPIRGGKIVIQAKRYTNTVGVSAVRDLYGTVLNEGATKGILVTTADYGPDAYEFEKNKPLKLISGSELLYLLEKHGHHAKIDLREAKKIISEREKGQG